MVFLIESYMLLLRHLISWGMQLIAWTVILKLFIYLLFLLSEVLYRSFHKSNLLQISHQLLIAVMAWWGDSWLSYPDSSNRYYN